MAKFDISAASNKALYDIKAGWDKNQSTILVVTGVIGLIGAGIMACRSTLKAPKTLENQQIRIEKVKAAHEDELIDDKQYKKELTKAYAHCTMEWVKLYAPSLIIAGLSAGMIFESNDIMKKKNASLAAAYGTLDGAFKAYRGRVVDKYGADEDKRLLTGAHEEEIEEETVDEKGKKKKIKRKINVLDPNDVENWVSYARIFGDFPVTSQHHTNQFVKSDTNMTYNLAQVRSLESYFNDRLSAHGWVSLNEVYYELGFQETKAGQSVGWTRYSTKGDTKIDFRIDENFWYRDDNGNLCRGILIDPNCHDITEEMPLEEM